MLNLLLLVAGFVPLVIGADWLVLYASSLAKRLRVPDLVIGLTIVAFGTSAPELVVNTFAAVDGNSGIVLGNILGSNIFNILGILGISAMVYPLTVRNSTTWIEMPLTALAALAVLILASDQLIDRAGVSVLTRSDGLVLLLFFTIFTVYTLIQTKQGVGDQIDPGNKPMLLILAGLIAGLILLVAGGKIIVHFGEALARGFGVSDRIIGLTIVSIGTSLPELATSVMAARKRKVDIAIGNVVGSNIFNAFFILGVSAVIRPVPVPSAAMLDLLVNGAASVLLFAFVFIGKGRTVDRKEGGLMTALYLGYLVWLLLGISG